MREELEPVGLLRTNGAGLGSVVCEGDFCAPEVASGALPLLLYAPVIVCDSCRKTPALAAIEGSSPIDADSESESETERDIAAAPFDASRA